jgi:hydroxymethylglutaryl-CoA synthase
VSGIVAYGAYLPHRRLCRERIGAALGGRSGSGTRAVAAYDEDTTTLAVEAARNALAGLPAQLRPVDVVLATTAPAYLDKTNAAAVHAALGLDRLGSVTDVVGSVGGGLAALVAALADDEPALAVLSDVRTGLPGGADERDGGDAAAAFVTSGRRASHVPVVAELVARAAVTEEFLDRWRLPASASSSVWEERFAEDIYLACADEAFGVALERADAVPQEVDHLVVTGAHARAVRAFTRACGVPPEAVTERRVAELGDSGAAHAGVLLADVLDRAGAGELIAVVTLADGAGVVLLRTTAELAARRARRPVADQVAAGQNGLDYATFLSWRGMLERQPPRRPDPEPPYAPPAYRRAAWKFAFTGSDCSACGTRQLPPGRICRGCGAVDTDQPVRLADVPGTVMTATVDHLAATPSPPLIAAVVDLDGGGRVRCQITDADAGEVLPGLRVEMTFRRLGSPAGIHNYFWKARPMRHPAFEART